VMVAVPGATAVTTPLATVATVGAEVVHVTGRPDKGEPAASRGVAASVHVAAGRRVQLVGDSPTDATGAGAGGVPPPGVVGAAEPPSPAVHPCRTRDSASVATARP
jgi:phosphoglycolate phosphatase-like HAD superfamily hydrolase